MKILALDIGSGGSKVVLYNNGQFDFFKEISAVAKLPADSPVKPDQTEDLVTLDGQKYLVGKSAVMVQKDHHFNTVSYDDIKKISPIIAKKYVDKYPDFDFVIFDISIAYIKNDSDLSTAITTALGIDPKKVAILPQGVGCKLAWDRFGPSPYNQGEDNPIRSYFGVDLGYNTIDFWQVVRSSLTSDGIDAEEKKGVHLIIQDLQAFCKTKAVEVSDMRLNEAIIAKNLVFRGVPVEGFSQKVDEACKKYIEQTLRHIDTKHKKIIDACDGVIFFGGGAELLKEYIQTSAIFPKEFVKVPEKAEFYNALGLCQYIVKREASIKK